MMKIYICVSIFVLVCLLAGGSFGYNCSNNTIGENTTRCIFCQWKRRLENYTEVLRLNENSTFNVTVCVNIIRNASVPGENITIHFTFNSIDLSLNYTSFNETCPGGTTSPTASISTTSVGSESTTPAVTDSTTPAVTDNTTPAVTDSTTLLQTSSTTQTELASTTQHEAVTMASRDITTTSTTFSTKEATISTGNITSPTAAPESSATTTKSDSPADKAAKLAEEAEKLSNGLDQTVSTEEYEAKVETRTIRGEDNEIGNSSVPLFTSTSTSTKVEKLQIGGNITGDIKVVIIASKETVSMNPETEDDFFIVDEDSPGTVGQANILSGKFLSIDAFAKDATVSISLAVFDLDISQPLSEALVEDAIKRAKIQANIPESSFSRSFMKQPAPICAFFDKNKLSKKGCVSKANAATRKLGCQCNHATVFAALVSAKVVTIPSGVKIMSYILEIISILFLIVTAIALIKVRNRVRGDRVKVQISLSLSLLALHFISVLHDAALLNNTTCEMWAVLTQFFLLSSAMWMLMEGLTLSFKTMDSVMRLLSGANAKKFAIFRYVISFSVPFVIVIITASIGFSTNPTTYMPIDPAYNPKANNRKYQHCWLGEEMLLGGAVIPVAVIVSCCIVIAVRMCYVVYRMSSESDNYKPTHQRGSTGEMEIMNTQHIKAALKATLVLLPVLGIPWFLGFFTAVENGGVRQAFMYLNTIVNGLQGVMLFFVYCVLGREVRQSIIKLLIRKGFRVSIISQEQSSTATSHGTYTTKLQGSTNGRHGSGSLHEDEKTASDKL